MVGDERWLVITFTILRFLEFVAELCRRAWLALSELVQELRGACFGRARVGDLRGQQLREMFWFVLFIG